MCKTSQIISQLPNLTSNWAKYVSLVCFENHTPTPQFDINFVRKKGPVSARMFEIPYVTHVYRVILKISLDSPHRFKKACGRRCES